MAPTAEFRSGNLDRGAVGAEDSQLATGALHGDQNGLER